MSQWRSKVFRRLEELAAADLSAGRVDLWDAIGALGAAEEELAAREEDVRACLEALGELISQGGASTDTACYALRRILPAHLLDQLGKLAF